MQYCVSSSSSFSSRFATALFLGLSVITVDAATVGYWTFDGGAVGATAATLPTTVNSPILDGVGAGISGGAAPVFSGILPGAVILDGLGGGAINPLNDTSLLFNNPNLPATPTSNAGSIVSVADPGG